MIPQLLPPLSTADAFFDGCYKLAEESPVPVGEPSESMENESEVPAPPLEPERPDEIESQNTTAETTEEDAVINVIVPESGQIVLNPYSLPLEIGGRPSAQESTVGKTWEGELPEVIPEKSGGAPFGEPAGVLPQPVPESPPDEENQDSVPPDGEEYMEL